MCINNSGGLAIKNLHISKDRHEYTIIMREKNVG